MAKGIQEIFPNEKESIYYTPYVPIKHPITKKVINSIRARGYLQYYYECARTFMSKGKILTLRKKSKIKEKKTDNPDNSEESK